MSLNAEREELFLLNAMASSTTEIIIWLGVIIVSGVGLYWFIYHFFNAQQIFETIDNDVLYISMRINRHCDDNYYHFAYNPETESGMLEITPRKICINSHSLEKCALLNCGPKNTTRIDLEKITLVEGTKSENFKIFGH